MRLLDSVCLAWYLPLRRGATHAFARARTTTARKVLCICLLSQTQHDLHDIETSCKFVLKSVAYDTNNVENVDNYVEIVLITKHFLFFGLNIVTE